MRQRSSGGPVTWGLPESTRIRGKEYGHRSDYREILKLLALLSDESRPEFIRWHGALCYFYREALPQEAWEEAMAYLAAFLCAGEETAPGPRRFDWQQDAQMIAAGVNAVAGFEVRSAPYLHW